MPLCQCSRHALRVLLATTALQIPPSTAAICALLDRTVPTAQAVHRRFSALLEHTATALALLHRPSVLRALSANIVQAWVSQRPLAYVMADTIAQEARPQQLPQPQALLADATAPIAATFVLWDHIAHLAPSRPLHAMQAPTAPPMASAHPMPLALQDTTALEAHQSAPLPHRCTAMCVRLATTAPTAHLFPEPARQAHTRLFLGCRVQVTALSAILGRTVLAATQPSRACVLQAFTAVCKDKAHQSLPH